MPVYTDRFTRRAKAVQATMDARRAAIRSHVVAHPCATGEEIRSALGLTLNEFKLAVQRMPDLQREGGHGRSAARYFT